ncbi:uncharacterized protein LOC124285249 [Haliotis rubra]|uniref:uncharacterized protein LOC124285249 n=1 Tax=Haliotis rubra TaxID=36100 RepID=UPI001EE591AA|nr:uncharacterized protein LOC124285249 [Haliotis rubra]
MASKEHTSQDPIALVRQSQRESKLPLHLREDYVLSNPPMDVDEEVAVTEANKSVTQRSRKSVESLKSVNRTGRNRKSENSKSTISGNSSVCSRTSQGSIRSVTSQLSEKQTARLEKLKKLSKLEELQRRFEEDILTQEELTRCDDIARKAQEEAEMEILMTQRRAHEIEREAQRERERLGTKITHLRRIREAEAGLKETPSSVLAPSAVHTSVLTSSSVPAPSAVHTSVQTSSSVPAPSAVHSSVQTPSSVPAPSAVHSSVQASSSVPASSAVHSSVQISSSVPASSAVHTPVMISPGVVHSPIMMSSGIPGPDAIDTHVLMPSSIPAAMSAQTSFANFIDQASPRIHNYPYQPCYSQPNCADPHYETHRQNLINSNSTLSDTVNVNPIPYDFHPVNPQVTPTMSQLFIPRPNLPNFNSGKERDFALLKIALDNLVSVHPGLTEQHNYQILLDRLGGPPKRLASAFMHDKRPFTTTLQALKERYGQPRQLVQSELGALMGTPVLKYGDLDAFDSFALSPTGAKSRAMRIASQAATVYKPETPREPRKPPPPRLGNRQPNPTALFLTREAKTSSVNRAKPFCPYGISGDHFLNECPEFKKLSLSEISKWLGQNRCSRCGRNHKERECTLRKPCHICKQLHLTVLHDALQQTSSRVYYMDQPSHPALIMLKIVPVILHGPCSTVSTYAILDDGSMQTMILKSTAQQLQLTGKQDSILLTTISQESVHCSGQSVKLQISSADQPATRFDIDNAFTADNLCMSEYTYPIENMQQHWTHLENLPLPKINGAVPSILIGSDNSKLILPIEPVRFGISDAPSGVHTNLGWTVQGPSMMLGQTKRNTCLLNQTRPAYLSPSHCVERLWQLDTLPFTSKQVIRSKQDKMALEILDSQITRIEVDGVSHYATPLLRSHDGTRFNARVEAVLPTLKRAERRLKDNSDMARTHNEAILKLDESGFVRKLTDDEIRDSKESWYIPHHVVEHNGKHRLVFNCSFEFESKNLSNHLLAGPTIGSSLLGVLLWFRQHAVAVTADIKAMFHQIRLLPPDRPLLRFLWRDMQCNRPPDVYEWQVLPFGTTCSPCCTSCALLKHAAENQTGNEEVFKSVSESFYVDNCLDSFENQTQAKQLFTKMRNVLTDGGFNIRQWASNVPEVVADLPAEARSEAADLWLNFGQGEPREPTLGLRWDCQSDELTYKHRNVDYPNLTMRIVYKVLASQYDPIGYLSSFIGQAKVIVQDLWKSKRNWNDSIENGQLRDRWLAWESELGLSPLITLPRCYIPQGFDPDDSTTQLHIFCDASERSESCRYKVFVGARVAEIQNLTDTHCWRYVNTQQNPADDITRGLSVKDLVEESRWRNGPAFLRQSADEWPESPSTGSDEPAELRKSAMLSTIVTQTPTLPDPTQYESWEVFISDVNEALDGRP